MANIATNGIQPNKSVRKSRTTSKNHKPKSKELYNKIPAKAQPVAYDSEKYHYKSTYLGSQFNQYYEAGIIKIPNMNPLQVQKPKKVHYTYDLEQANLNTACALFTYLNNSFDLYHNYYNSSCEIAEIITRWVKNHIHYIDLSTQIDPKNPYLRQNYTELLYPAEYRLQKLPKYTHGFFQEKYNADGEFLYTEVSSYTNLQTASSRKRKLVNKFADKFEPLYQNKNISLLFVTLTRINYANQNIHQFISSVKKRFKKRGVKLHGYVWVFEAGEKTNMLHYHIAFATDRMQFNRLPIWLKFESLWGQRTETTFVKKSIRNYLSKYLKKGSPFLEGFRSCGSSKL
jgi:hypothetical protein